MREVLEETGLIIEVGEQIGVYEIIDPGREHRLIVYSWASVKGGELKPSSDTAQLGFFSKEDLPHLDMTDLTKQVLQDIGWL